MISSPPWTMMLPDGERHFAGMDRRGVPAVIDYQYEALGAAVFACAQRRVAVDVGAHVGMQTLKLARSFKRVHAIEPNPETAACLRLNVRGCGGVVIHEMAAGASEGRASLVAAAGNSGDVAVAPGGSTVRVARIDDLGLRDVDLIKLDVQGYERLALEGARGTIERDRPVIVFEEEPPGKLREHLRAESGAARALLLDLGYTILGSYSMDVVAVPRR